jgi:cytochrome c biogenesis protein CcmG/thiol:disulfide interchange protein DsbE
VQLFAGRLPSFLCFSGPAVRAVAPGRAGRPKTLRSVFSATGVGRSPRLVRTRISARNCSPDPQIGTRKWYPRPSRPPARTNRNNETPARDEGSNEAADEIRTRDPQLGKLMLYQLSYCRSARRGYRAGPRRAGAVSAPRGGEPSAPSPSCAATSPTPTPRDQTAGRRDGLPFRVMRRSAVPALLGFLAIVLVAVLAYAMTRTTGDDKRSESLSAQVEAGKVVPAPGADRALPRLSGTGTVRLADLRGKVVVLNFWASWCDPCKDEAPILERAQRRLQHGGVGTVLGVTYQDDPVKSRAFVKRFELSYPSLRDPERGLAQQFGSSQMPETFVLDREGRIRAIAYGAVTQEFLDGALARAGVKASSAR